MATLTAVFAVLGAFAALCTTVTPLIPAGKARDAVAAVSVDLGKLLKAFQK